MAAAALIHEDHTECHHDGQPVAAYGDPDGPRCPDGRLITHVRLGAQSMTVDDANARIAALARTLFEALTPLVTAIVEACGRIAADPAVAALAAAATQAADAHARGYGNDPASPNGDLLNALPAGARIAWVRPHP